MNRKILFPMCLVLRGLDLPGRGGSQGEEGWLGRKTKEDEKVVWKLDEEVSAGRK